MRLSKKQLEFLQAINDRPLYPGAEFPLICIDRMPEHIWFSFHSERAVYQWVRNLADRRLVNIENDCFARLTEQGRQACKTADGAQKDGGAL